MDSGRLVREKYIMAEYYIGQKFLETYPPDAAEWCNTHDAYIDEIEPIDNKRQFEIKAIPEETAEQREKKFNNTFLKTSKGNYRLQPRGYSNAQQSIDTVNGNVNALGALTEEIAAMVIFYPTPDFTKPEQCTEEWLIAHQYNIEPMTKEEWSLYYLEFSKLYALKQYKKTMEEQENVNE